MSDYKIFKTPGVGVPIDDLRLGNAGITRKVYEEQKLSGRLRALAVKFSSEKDELLLEAVQALEKILERKETLDQEPLIKKRPKLAKQEKKKK